MTATRFRL